MSKSVNKWIGVGVIGRDAEVQHTPSGSSVTKFSMATSYRYKKNGEYVEDTDWHNIVAWNKEAVAPYLTKGTKVYVEGRYTTRSYQDKNGDKKYTSEVVCDDIVLLGGNKASGENSQRQVASASDFDDDTPF
jgi:single-strand DNA-binding protein